MVEKAQMGGTLRNQGKRWRRRLGDLCPPIPSELPLAFSLLLFQKMHLSKSAGTLTVVLPNPGLFSSTGCQTVCSQSPALGLVPVALFLHVFSLWLISHALECWGALEIILMPTLTWQLSWDSLWSVRPCPANLIGSSDWPRSMLTCDLSPGTTFPQSCDFWNLISVGQ